MEAVARRARAGKTTLYRWWPTKGALLLAVYQCNKQITGFPDTGTLEGDLAAILETLFAHWRRPEGAQFRLLIAEAQSDADLAGELEAYRQSRLDLLEAVVARAETRGELPPGLSRRDMAEALMALAWLHLLTDQLDADPARLARTLCAGWSL
jgi:AcrR family transcriptional regulator